MRKRKRGGREDSGQARCIPRRASWKYPRSLEAPKRREDSPITLTTFKYTLLTPSMHPSLTPSRPSTAQQPPTKQVFSSQREDCVLVWTRGSSPGL